MAISKLVTIPCGIQVGYWEIVTFSIVLESQEIVACVKGWLNQQAKLDGLPAINDAFMEIRLPFAAIQMDPTLLTTFLGEAENAIEAVMPQN